MKVFEVTMKECTAYPRQAKADARGSEGAAGGGPGLSGHPRLRRPLGARDRQFLRRPWALRALRAAAEHFLRVAAAQGTGAAERQLIHDGDRPAGRAALGSHSGCRHARTDHDQVESSMHHAAPMRSHRGDLRRPPQAPGHSGRSTAREAQPAPARQTSEKGDSPRRRSGTHGPNRVRRAEHRVRDETS